MELNQLHQFFSASLGFCSRGQIQQAIDLGAMASVQPGGTAMTWGMAKTCMCKEHIALTAFQR